MTLKPILNKNPKQLHKRTKQKLVLGIQACKYLGKKKKKKKW